MNQISHLDPVVDPQVAQTLTYHALFQEIHNGPVILDDVSTEDDFQFRNPEDIIRLDREIRKLDHLFRKFRKDERTAVLIDGANTYEAVTRLGFSIDYLKVSMILERYADLYNKIQFFTAVNPDPTDRSRYNAVVDWMERHDHGYRVIKKPFKSLRNDEGKTYIKGNMDVEITVNALDRCNKADHIVLFTGDGDFKYLIETLQAKEKRVTVISTHSSLATELSRQADHVIDLRDLQPYIERSYQD